MKTGSTQDLIDLEIRLINPHPLGLNRMLIGTVGVTQVRYVIVETRWVRAPVGFIESLPRVAYLNKKGRGSKL